MAKYTVNFACGHTETVQLYGKESERQRKIAYWESYGCCSECYKAQKRAEDAAKAADVVAKAIKRGYKPMRIHYRDYKDKYTPADAVPCSYDAETKTIEVFVADPAKGAEILAMITPVMDAALTLCIAENRPKVEEMFSRIRAASAHKLIECFKDYEVSGDIKRDAAELVRAINMHQRYGRDDLAF